MDTKRGRPPKAIDERANEHIQIRLTAEEKKQLSDAAKLAGMPLSAWMRDRLGKAAKREEAKQS